MTNYTKPTLKKLVFFSLLIFFSFNLLSAQQKAFPSAVGSGANATGGRGGTVLHVTNLDWNNNPGSLKWAIEQTYPRTIVFDVSGTIRISSQYYSLGGQQYSDLTIAGQTAPEGGITIEHNWFTLSNMSNVIIRYVRFVHVGYFYAGGAVNGTAINFNVSGYGIVDHLSTRYSWNSVAFQSRDNGETIPVEGVTVQNSIFGDCKTGMLVGPPPNLIDPVINNSGDYTIYRNLFAHISHRFPNATGNGRFDIINNIAYNPKSRLSTIFNNAEVNLIGNYYKDGPASTLSVNKIASYINVPNPPSQQIYSTNNIVEHTGFTKYDTSWNGLFVEWANNSGGQSIPADESQNRVFSQFDLIGFAPQVEDVDDAYVSVLQDVGANKFLNADGTYGLYLDSVDQTYIDETINGTGSYKNLGNENELTYPVLPNTNRPDNFYNPNKSEHIPEAFYDLYMPDGASHNDIAPSGYTWLEEYLNGVDRENAIPLVIESLAVTPQVVPELRVSETIELTATIFTAPEDTEGTVVNQNGTWTSSDESIATVDENGVVTAIATSTEAPYQATVTITFTITADDGVEYSDSTEITVFPEALQASAGTDQQICEGETIALIASGGTNYLWITGETTAEINVTPDITTTYSVVVSDDFEQSEEVSVTVTVNPLPEANAGEDQTICQGDTIMLIASGGDEYLWSTGETTASIDVSPSTETMYAVEVTTNGCSNTDEVTVFVNAAPNLTVSEDVAIVEGTSTTISVSGSDNYLWSTNETTDTIEVSPLETTTYTVSSTNTDGCTTVEEIIVTVVPEVIADAGEDVIICQGESITLTASGGINYMWDTGDITAELTVSPLETTTYNVTVEDAFGFSDTDSVTVTVNEAPNITVGDVQYVMIGNSITLTATGGDSYLWDTGETSASIIVSPEIDTTYAVTGFSENGCQNTAEVLVVVVEELNASAGNDVTICFGESTTLIASGGVSYEWNTGHTITSYTVNPMETTTYSVTVGDGFGNFDTDDVTVTVVDPPIANAGSDQTICAGDSVTLSASGGDAYIWSTGETTASIDVSPNSNTTYSVEVSNGGCSDSADVTVFVNDLPNISVSEDIVIMETQTTVLAASGSDNYLWSTGETTASIEVGPTSTTTYTVTSTNVFGCSESISVTVTVVPEVIADAGNDVTICSGESITLNASGGTSYLWNTGDTGSSPTFSPSVTTVYSVTVSDDYGNTDSDSVMVIVNETPEVYVEQDVFIVQGESTTLVAEGAVSYQWSTGETTSSISVSPTETTTYTVIGTANGCSSEAEVTVNVEPIFEASAGEDQDVCQNDDYEVVLTANTGDSYLWSTGETAQSITVSPLSTTTYSVTVFYGIQEDTDNVTVYVNPNPNVQIVNGDSVEIMSGEFVTLSATGANTYQWNNGATQPNIAVSPTETTTYEVRGYIGNCYDEKQVIVNVIPEVEADAGEDVEICLGETVTLTAEGGEEYLWSNGETSQSIDVSPFETTEYTVTAFNAIDFDEDSVIVFVDTDCDVEPIEGDPLDFGFKVYPNPANDTVNITLEGTTALSRIYLYDITGKLLHSEIISNQYLSMSTTRQIDVSDLESGMYLVRLVDIDQDISKQLIIQ